MQARAGACCAGASRGTMAERLPTAAWCSSSSSVLDTDCPPGVRRGPLEARQCGRSVCGLTLARWASVHQASAGRPTAAGDHAPIVERSIANQQQPHHHHQADPWILPRQPTPKALSLPKNQATHPSLPSRLATYGNVIMGLTAWACATSSKPSGVPLQNRERSADHRPLFRAARGVVRFASVLAWKPSHH
jgi:hypothetical protein